MLTDIPPLRPRRGQRKARRVRQGAGPVVAGPVLVAAEYEPGAWVQLTFDRAVDASGADTAAVFVDDNGTRWQGSGPAIVLGPTVLRVELGEVGPWPGSGVKLTATGGAGIVASDDDVAWAGVTDLGLPFS